MASLPKIAEQILSEEELDAWSQVLEEIDSDPLFLHHLKEHNPQLLNALYGVMKRVHSAAARMLWRSQDGLRGSARPDQLMPGTPGSASDRIEWRVWLIMAGRGSGKSFAAAQTLRELVERDWSIPNPKIALVSTTLEAVREDMIEQYLMPILGPLVKKYNRSSLEIFCHNGLIMKGYSSERPGRLRGPNFVAAWVDEVAALLDADMAPSEDSTWSNLEFATRADDGGTWEPRIIATTTPKPVRLLRIRDKQDEYYPGLVDDPDVVITHMTTYDNLKNLAKGFAKRIVSRYEGTRLAEQELQGKLLDEIEGALWTDRIIAGMRDSYARLRGPVGGYTRTAISVDPTVGDGRVSNDECGIIVGTIGRDGLVWILDDLSIKGTPSQWATQVSYAFRKWSADMVVAEVNQGGAMVREIMSREFENIPLRTVRAFEGKRIRAEGPALSCERGEVKFAQATQGGVDPKFTLLIDQLMTWDPFNEKDESPDRLDAFCQLIHFLKPALGTATIVNNHRLYANARGRRRKARTTIGRLNPTRNPRRRGTVRAINKGKTNRRNRL